MKAYERSIEIQELIYSLKMDASRKFGGPHNMEISRLSAMGQEAEEAVKAELNNPDLSEVQIFCFAQVLTQLSEKDRKIVPTYFELLDHPNPIVRWRALSVFGEFLNGKEEARHLILKAKGPMLIEEARIFFAIVGNMSISELSATLENLSQHPESKIKRTALIALAHLALFEQSQRVVPLIIKKLADDALVVVPRFELDHKGDWVEISEHSEISQIANNLIRTRIPYIHQEQIADVVALTEHEDMRVREGVFYILAEKAPYLNRMILQAYDQGLRDQSLVIRNLVMGVLGKLAKRHLDIAKPYLLEVVPALLQYFKETDDPDIQINILEILRALQCQDENSLALLDETVREGHREPLVRAKAVEVSSSLIEDSVKRGSFLISFLSSKNHEEMRYRAKILLIEMGGVVVPSLIEEVQKTSDSKGVISALEMSYPEDSREQHPALISTLEGAALSSDHDIRNAALSALESVNPARLQFLISKHAHLQQKSSREARWKERIDSMVQAIQRIIDNRYRLENEDVEGFSAILIVELIEIGEGVKNIPEEVKIKYSQVDWKYYRKLRDELAHQRVKVNIAERFQATQNDLVGLQRTLKQIQKEN